MKAIFPVCPVDPAWKYKPGTKQYDLFDSKNLFSAQSLLNLDKF